MLDSITLWLSRLGAPRPSAIRTVRVPAENRTVRVPAENRTVRVPAENRTVRVRGG